MGGANTKFNPLNKSEEEVIQAFLPVFYDAVSPVTETDVPIAKGLWSSITQDTALGYLALKGTEGFEYTSCISFFYDSFYTRLFDIHPSCRPLFKKGIKAQGRHLVALISMALACVTDDDKFTRQLERLTKTHNELGVKAYEYAIVAETHFWTMRKVCGEAYGPEQHGIWTKIISRMLKVMVPSAVAYEIHSGGMKVEREKASCISEYQTTVEANDPALDEEMEKKYGVQ